MKKIMTLLLTVLLMVGMAFLPKGGDLTGTWEGELSLSVLGLGVEEPGAVDGTIRFIFDEEGTGIMEIRADLPLAELPVPELQRFQYTVEEDVLTITFETGEARTFGIWQAGDYLTLEGNGELDLMRV